MKFILHQAELLDALHCPRMPLDTTSGTAMSLAESLADFAGRNPLTLLSGSRRFSLASVIDICLGLVRSRLDLASSAPSFVSTSIADAELADSVDMRTLGDLVSNGI